MSSADNIKVAIKARPIVPKEREKEKNQRQWRIKDNTIQQIDSQSDPFVFDHIFDESATNQQLFDVVAKPIVDASLRGFNGTIFAYGQTSSGKTYTMLGDDKNPGVVVLAAQEIFKGINADRQFLLRVAYMEIYNEKVFDLLNVKDCELKIHETTVGEIVVNCQDHIVTSVEQIMDYLHQGNRNRKIGETNMNERSSRSHALFRIVIESRELNTEPEESIVQTSNLYLVDLAGSERADQTGATGTRFKEGTHINKSLLSLSCVISKLSEAEGDKYINYRDSKLTRLLQASLGGNALTAIICTIKTCTAEETYSTLSFAMRAKSIKNKPHINEVLTDTVMMKQLQNKIKQLEARLDEERQKHSNIRVPQIMAQIRDYELKFIGSQHPGRAGNAQEKARRRTWCAISTKSDQNDESHIQNHESDIVQVPIQTNIASSLITCRRTFTEFGSHERFSTEQIADIPENDFLNVTPTNENGFVFKTPKAFRHRRPDRHTNCKASTSNRCTQLEQELQELQDFTNIESKVNVDHEVVKSLTLKLIESEEKLRKYELERAEHQGTINDHQEMQLKLETAEHQLSRLESKILELENEIKRSKCKESELTQNLEVKTKQISNFLTQISHLEKSSQNAVSFEFEFEHLKKISKTRIDELLGLLQEKDAKIKAFTKDKYTMQKEFDEMSTQLLDAIEESERIKILENDVKSLEEKNCTFENHILKYRKEICDLEQKLTESKEKIKDLEGSNLKLYGKLKEQEQLNGNQPENIQNSEIANFDSVIVKITEECAALQGGNGTLQAKHDRSDTEEHIDGITRSECDDLRLDSEVNGSLEDTLKIDISKSSNVEALTEENRLLREKLQNLEAEFENNIHQRRLHELNQEEEIKSIRLLEECEVSTNDSVRNVRSLSMSQDSLCNNFRTFENSFAQTDPFEIEDYNAFTEYENTIAYQNLEITELQRKLQLKQFESKSKLEMIAEVDENVSLMDSSLKARFDDLAEERDHLNKLMESLQRELDCKCQELKLRDEEVEHLKEERNTLTLCVEEMNVTHNRLLEVSKELDEISNERDSLITERDRLTQEIEVFKLKFEEIDSLKTVPDQLTAQENQIDELEVVNSLNISTDRTHETVGEEVTISAEIVTKMSELRLIKDTRERDETELNKFKEKQDDILADKESRIRELENDIKQSNAEMLKMEKEINQQNLFISASKNTLQINLVQLKTLETELNGFREKYKQLEVDSQQTKQEKDEENERLKALNAQLNEKIVQIEEELDISRTICSELKNEVQNDEILKETVKALEDDLKVLKDLNAQLEEKKSEYKSELATLRARMQASENIQSEKENLEKKIATLSAENLSLQIDLAKNLDEKHKVQESISHNLKLAEEECVSLRKNMDELKETLETLENERDSLMVEKLRLETKIQNETVDLERLEILETELTNFKSQNLVLSDQIVCSQSEKRFLENSITQKSEQLLKLEKEYEQLKNNIKELDQRLLQEKRKSGEIHETFSKQTTELQSLVEQLQQEKKLIEENYVKERETLHNSLENIKAEKEKQNSEIHGYKSRTEILETALTSVTKEKENLEEKLIMKNNEISSHLGELTKLKESNDEHSKKVQEIEILKNKLQTLQLDLEKLKSLYVAAKEKLESSEEQVSGMNRKYSELQADFEDISKEKTQLLVTHEKMSKKLTELENQLQAINVSNEIEIVALNARVGDLNSEKLEISQQLDEIQKTLNFKIKKLQEELDLSNSKNKLLETDLQRLTKELKDYKENCVDLKAEIVSFKNKSRSDQSFSEKETQINELKISLKSVLAEKLELEKKQAVINNLIGENDDLKVKNQTLVFEVDDLRKVSQQQRKSKRHSMHDEKRQSLWGTTREIGTQTFPTDRLCNCEQFDTQIKELRRTLKIKDCQINSMLMHSKNNPLTEENEALKKTIRAEEAEINKLRTENQKLLKRLKIMTEQDDCNECAKRIAKVTRNATCQTTDGKHGSEIMLKSENERLTNDLIKLEEHLNAMKEQNDADKNKTNANFEIMRKKYEQMKRIATSASEQHKHFEEENQKLKKIVGEEESSNKMLRAEIEKLMESLKRITESRKCNECAARKTTSNSEGQNSSGDDIDLKTEHETLRTELHALQMQFKETENLCRIRLEEKETQIQNDRENHRLKFEKLKNICSTRNERIKELESKLDKENDSITVTLSEKNEQLKQMINAEKDVSRELKIENEKLLERLKHINEPTKENGNQAVTNVQRCQGSVADDIDIKDEYEKLKKKFNDKQIELKDIVGLCRFRLDRIKRMEDKERLMQTENETLTKKVNKLKEICVRSNERIKELEGREEKENASTNIYNRM